MVPTSWKSEWNQTCQEDVCQVYGRAAGTLALKEQRSFAESSWRRLTIKVMGHVVDDVFMPVQSEGKNDSPTYLY